MRLAPLLVLVVTGCELVLDPAPPRASIPPPVYCADPGGEAPLIAGDEPVGAYVVGTGEDLVRVPGDHGWAHVAAPVDAASRAQLLALVEGDVPDARCAGALVVPFADANRAVVWTTRMVRVVRFSPWRARDLDQAGAMLEGCRMNDTRDTLGCSLDLGWSPARFDADGESLLPDAFVPLWRR